MNRVPFFDALGRDLRTAVRLLLRSPGFTVTALVTLALVIGANTAVFSLADAILFKPLPYPQPNRLAEVVVNVRSTKGAFLVDSHDGTAWQTLRDHAAALDVAVTVASSGFGNDVNLVAGRSAVSVAQVRVSAGYFRVLGVPPVVGREFTADEDRPGGPAVAVLSYDLWQRLFAGDPSALGDTILLRGERYQVVGVMPRRFRNPGEDADVWTPVRPSTTGEGGGDNYGIIARVRPGHTWAEAVALLPRLDPDYFRRLMGPAWAQSQPTGQFALVPMQQALTSDAQAPLLMLVGAVGLVLLIACVNLAALLLARGGARTREIATRMALGSGRGAVIRQLFVESLVLGLTGGALGVLVGYIALAALKGLGGGTFAEWTHVTLDGRALALTAGLSILTSTIFGLAPAIQASRVDVNAALSEGGARGIAGRSRHGARRVLVGAEVALGVVLLVVTGLLIRTFVNLRSLDPGFDPSHVVTASVSLQDARYDTSAKMNQLFDRTLRRLTATPGVESAAVSLELPYRRLLNMNYRFTDEAQPSGPRIANVMYVTPDFFRTLRIPLLAGRPLGDTDTAASLPVVAVSQDLVTMEADRRNPIGREIQLAGANREVVGVVGNMKVKRSFSLPGMLQGPLTSAPLILLPASQTPDSFMAMHMWFSPMWTVRARDTATAEAALRQAIAGADPLLPVGRVQLLSDVTAAATSEQRLLMALVAALAGSALFLTAFGLYGLIAHTVTERRRELGIRIALGATPAETVRRVAFSGITLAALGAAAGAGLAWMAVQVLDTRSLLWGVQSHDPLTFVGVVACLLLVASVASVVPALRILRLDPVRTLRE